jgi:ATP-dependent RNA helicase DDX56/DBP9
MMAVRANPSHIDFSSFRVKLFLERFSLKSAVLNSELPQNSRYHAVQQFNKGVFDLLIASDENAKGEAADDSDEESEDSGEENEEDGEEGNDDEEEEEKKAKKSPKKDLKASKKSRRADDEYGVARGMDFQNVSAGMST